MAAAAGSDSKKEPEAFAGSKVYTEVGKHYGSLCDSMGFRYPNEAPSLETPFNVSIGSAAGERHLLVANWGRALYQKVPLAWATPDVPQYAITLAGVSGSSGYDNGDANRSRFNQPTAIVADPLMSDRYYFCDRYSVRVWEDDGRRSGTVKLLAGGGESNRGFADAAGEAAKFNHCGSLLCVPDGRTLLVTDQHNNLLRAVDVKSGAVSTVAGDQQIHNEAGTGTGAGLSQPTGMCFDRIDPAHVLIACGDAVMRVNFKTGVSRAIPIKSKYSDRHAIHGVAHLPNGLLVVSCTATHSVYTLDTARDGNTMELLAGLGQTGDMKFDDPVNGDALKATFHTPQGLCIDEVEKCVYVADTHNNRIRKITLPANYFPAPPPPPAPVKPAATAVTSDKPPVPSVASAVPFGAKQLVLIVLFGLLCAAAAFHYLRNQKQ